MSNLSLDFPVLLGPVRVETRFTQTHLLVRVFPDEWAVDKFEPRPTRAELAALDAYWTALWAAGDSTVAERAAWEELVARVPSGRATWLLTDHRPANPAERPATVPERTTVLVVVSPQALAAADRQPTIDYWTAVWRAHGDRAKLRAADIALLAAVGQSRAAAIRGRRPSNVDRAATVPDDGVLVAFLVLTPPPDEQVAPESWTVAATAKLLPDKFVVYGFVGDTQVFAVPGGPVRPALAVSPDPGAEQGGQLRVNEQDGTLFVPSALLWLTDFGEAVEAGMGIRVELKDEFREGLDRLVVLGLREGATPEQSATAFGELLTAQLRSPAGLAMLPQGTPTNNSEQASAGPPPAAEAESARATAAGLAAADDWTSKTDGEWFTELLGLDPALLAGVPNAEGTDRRDARAAHTALWPATWGYYLPALLDGVLTEEQIAQTRQFFIEYVSGRGPLPVLRIGRQPYGILPTTVFSRLAWPDTAPHRTALGAVLTEAAKDWQAAADAKVRSLAKPGTDPHQTLLDILALHPTSAEYYQRYANSVEDLVNRANLLGAGAAVADALETGLNLPAPLRTLLTRLGRQTSDPAADPDLLRRLFADEVYPVLAPIVDDRPLSEVDKIRIYTTDERDYLRWLAESDLETIRTEQGFLDDKPPAALLYLLARHAVLLAWAEGARRLALATPGAEVPDVRDAPFVHVRQEPDLASESRYRALYSTDPAIDPDRLVHEHLHTVLGDHPATRDVAEQAEALGILAGLPTAKLERVFAEHVDCATYRLDAWRLGLVTERLAELRQSETGTPKRGLHLGAYGWLENVKPDKTIPTTEPVPAELTKALGTDPIPHYGDNGGYIHAPSPAHARTAAVLRAGYLANGSKKDPGAFSVNLSSNRVRTALTIVDGMRQGQSLNALLGYRFERGLHDRAAGLERFIAGLRLKFPLRANKIDETAPGEEENTAKPTSIEQVEARNVIDGLELVRLVNQRIADGESPDYPFGFDDLPPAEGQTALIGLEVDALRDVTDALADLAVAEGTHQALQGNTDRASAAMDAFTKNGLPPEPAVVDTPRSGITLTHRLGLQLSPDLSPDAGAPLLGRNNPRARAEPGVNAWLNASLLPKPENVVALVTWKDQDGDDRSRVVTQAEAGIAAIDLLSVLRPADQAAMTDLDDRILGVVIEKARPRPDLDLHIEYTTRVAGKVSFFELSPVIAAVRTLLTTARPLRPTDLVPAAGTAKVTAAMDDAVSLPRARPAAVLESIVDLRTEVDEFVADLRVLYPVGDDPVRAEVLSGIDEILADYAKLTVGAGGFGLIRSSWGELALWRRDVYRDVLAAVAAIAERMGRALTAAEALIEQYDDLPSGTSNEEKFRILDEAQRLLVTEPPPRPSTPSRMRLDVGSQRFDFANRLDDLTDVAETTQTSLSGLLEEVADQLPLTDIDPLGLDLTPFEDRVVAFGQDLLARAEKLSADLTKRVDAATEALAVYDAAAPGPERVRAGTDALKALLGEDVLAVPHFTPPAAVAQQWRKSRADSEKLVAHLKPARDFPVDDWLYGMARVREKPRLWEKTVLLADALLGPGGLLGTTLLGWKEPLLSPVQLPYVPKDHWLGLEFAKDPNLPDQLAEDRLLFTAHYAAGLSADTQCGLVFDEWTEVIPAEKETTGVALHVDGPNAEPPQAMLLVAPPVREAGTWTADDLVDAVTETFELARTRAVEPEHLDDTAYAHMLPATVLSATREPITIGTDLALANLRWKASHD
jgi:hypothetical protein